MCMCVYILYARFSFIWYHELKKHTVQTLVFKQDRAWIRSLVRVPLWPREKKRVRGWETIDLALTHIYSCSQNRERTNNKWINNRSTVYVCANNDNKNRSNYSSLRITRIFHPSWRRYNIIDSKFLGFLVSSSSIRVKEFQNFLIFLWNEFYAFIFQTVELWFFARHWCEHSNYSTLRISKCHSWMSVRYLQRESLAYFLRVRVNGTANHAVLLTAVPKSTASTVYWLALLAI